MQLIDFKHWPSNVCAESDLIFLKGRNLKWSLLLCRVVAWARVTCHTYLRVCNAKTHRVSCGEDGGDPELTISSLWWSWSQALTVMIVLHFIVYLILILFNRSKDIHNNSIFLWVFLFTLWLFGSTLIIQAECHRIFVFSLDCSITGFADKENHTRW